MGECLEVTVGSSDKIVAPPYPIGDDDKRQTKRPSLDHLPPPRIDYCIVAENSKAYGHKYWLKITAESSSWQVPILYFTQPVGPLRAAEVDQWLKYLSENCHVTQNVSTSELDKRHPVVRIFAPANPETAAFDQPT